MARTQRKEEQVASVREGILQAAARAFARSGYRAATMRAIAQEAGYTAPTLYSYFDSKEQMFDALCELIVGEVRRCFDTPRPEGLTMRQSLELHLFRLMSVVDSHSDVFAFFMAVCSGGDSGPGDKSRYLMEEDELIRQRGILWMREVSAGDPLADRDPELLATLLDGICSAFLERWVKEGRPHPAVDLVPLLSDLFFSGASGSPQSRSASR